MIPSRHIDVGPKNPASRILFRSTAHAVELRPLNVTDAPAIARAVEESYAELKKFMLFAHFPNSLEVQLERLKRVHAQYQLGTDFGMGLFHLETGEFLVSLGLHRRLPLNDQGLEIGYWTRSAVAGQGYATLATRLGIVYAFEFLRCNRVQILHNQNNLASRRVIEKCGFVHEGALRNGVMLPRPDMVAAGYVAGPVEVLYALVPEDRNSLPWYEEIRSQMEVFNILGEKEAEFSRG